MLRRPSGEDGRRRGAISLGIAAIAFLSPALTAQVINIGCGRPGSYTDSAGVVWQSDTDYTGGNRNYSGYPVSGTPDPQLYAWSRIGYYGDFNYSIPVSNGSYTVTLKFAETQYFAAGQRVFNVALNGTTVLSNLDIVASVGALKAVDKQFPVQVTRGAVQIAVTGVVNVGTLSAIQIAPNTSSQPPALQVTGGPLTFSAAQGGSNPTAQTVTIANTGGGTLGWSASATQSWISLPATSGAGSTTFSIGVVTGSLSQGTYTDTVTISDPGVSGSPATVNVTFNVGPPGGANAASFLKLDTTTHGSWPNFYGGDGYDFNGVTAALPSYTQATVTGAAAYVWSGLTTDTRALQEPGGGRIAATWYSAGVFSFALNMSSGSHQVALYALDYDTAGRSEQIDILDGGTSAVLDTETLSNFQAGDYLVWNLTGNIVIRVTPLKGPNAVVSGLFFGTAPAGTGPASPILTVSTGSLTFSATAGGSNPASLPLTISNAGGGTLSWTASKTQPWLTLSSPNGTGQATLSVGANISGLSGLSYSDTITIAAAGASGSPAAVTVTLNLSTGTPTLSVSTGLVNLSAAPGGANPSTVPVTISNAGGGTLNWTAVGTQPWLTLSAAAGSAPSILNIGATINGLDPGTYSDTVTVTAAGAGGSPATITITLNLSSSAVVSFVKLDTTSSGTWKGSYGGDGYEIEGVAPALPPYAQVTVSGASTYEWSGSTSDSRALQLPSGTSRIAAVWYSSTPFTMDVNLTDGNSRQVALYAVDFDNANRSERIDVLDSGSGTVLDTRNFSGFSLGQYLVWTVTGHVTFRVTPAAGPNTVVNGIFFAPSGAVSTSPVLSLSSTTITLSAASGGANPTSLPVTVSNSGAGTLNWTATKTQSWLTLSSTGGTAPATLSIGANVSGLNTGTYSDTVTVSAAGASGSPAKITVTLYIGGLTTVSFVKGDSSTSGNWTIGYGAEGYDYADSTPSLPSWAQLTVAGASTFQWSGAASAPAALQPVTGTTRIAAVWYAPTSFTMDLALTDGNTHQIALYLCDYDGSGRAEQVQVLDGVTGAVLDTQTANSFQPGRYLVWSIAGHVTFKITRNQGPNAVVNGIFLGGSYEAALPAVLTLDTPVLRFSGTAGASGPVPQTVSIANSGGSQLNWSATKTQSWVSLSPASESGAGTLTVSVSTAGLSAGTYSDTVTIAAPGAQGSPAHIGVTLILSAPTTAGPILYLTLDTATLTPTAALDTSGNNLNAAIIGSPVLDSGVMGQALTFDGAASYLETQPTALPAMTGELTLFAWIKTTNSSRNETIISKYDISGTEDGYIFETTAAGYIGVHIGGDNVSGPHQDCIDSFNKINDGKWHFVAAIIRTGQDIGLYVDGGLSSIFYLTTFSGATGPPVGIAGPSTHVASLFTGSMDQVAIYSRALSTNELLQLFGGTVTTVPGGQPLYNGISMPVNFPPPTTPTQALRIPYYINNGPRVIPIDVGRQLFVDNFLIEQTTLTQTQHQPSIYPNPVLTPGSPISGGAWYDPATKQYEMWYYNGVTNDYRYAYSSDGMNWTLPAYPSGVLVPGTNEVVTGGDTVWLDQQEIDPNKRYKSFGVDAGAGKIYVYFSADGIHNWAGPFDYGIINLSDRSTVFWNPFRKVWVNSDRSSAGLPATPLRDASDPRVRFYSEAPDLMTWTPANPANTFWTGPDDHDPPYYLNNPGGQPPELYNLDAVAYESVMVGLYSWFYPGSGYSNYTLPGPILVELGVGFSRDGFSWVRPTRGSGPNPGGAFIPASDAAGTWNAFNTQSVGGGFLVVGDELWFYFSGRTLQKPLDGTFSTGIATLRRDGFYSMDAGATQGTLVTHPVRFSGNHMFVNVNDPSGQLTVDVLDANGNVIPGFEAPNSSAVQANTTMQEISWAGQSIGSLAGQAVKFRFYLTNGSLYSFWVTSSPQGASNGYVAAGGPGFTGITDTVGSAAHP